MDYRGCINAQAMQVLAQTVHVPDYHLMVGSAEDLSSQPIVTYVDFMPKDVYKRLPDNKMTFEQVQENLASGTLTIDDFYQNVYPLGDAIVK